MQVAFYYLLNSLLLVQTICTFAYSTVVLEVMVIVRAELRFYVLHRNISLESSSESITLLINHFFLVLRFLL